jgi:hypothetical protein
VPHALGASRQRHPNAKSPGAQTDQTAHQTPQSPTGDKPDMTTTLNTRCWMWTLWPSFVVAGLATGVFFSLFDPMDLRIFGEPVRVSAMAAYTLGFLGFWVVAAAAVWLALLLARPCMIGDQK